MNPRQPARQRRAAQQGLTLAELLVAVAILAILSLLMVSSFQQRMKDQALQSAASATAEWLSGIRKRAMQQDLACTIAILPSSNSLEAASSNLCGSFPALDIRSVATGSATVNFCYRNTDPIQAAGATTACSSGTTNSTTNLTFSPRGTNQINAVLEFYAGSGQAKTCTVVIQPNGIIRYGTINSGFCQSST